jgi:hypothetical protein
MSPEISVIVIFGAVQLAGLLALGLMLREISVSTRIQSCRAAGLKRRARTAGERAKLGLPILEYAPSS